MKRTTLFLSYYPLASYTSYCDACTDDLSQSLRLPYRMMVLRTDIYFHYEVDSFVVLSVVSL